jgi:hypothetical protein
MDLALLCQSIVGCDRRLGLALGAAALVIAAPAATASPLDDPTAGRAVFTGAASTHATSILLNPAALAIGPTATGVHFYTGGTLTIDQLSIDRQVMDENGQLAPGDKVGAVEFGPGATFALWTVTNSRNLVVGGHLVSPAPGQQFVSGEAALRYHSLGGTHRTTELGTLAAAYRIVSRVYLGGAVSLTRTRVAMRFARDTALEAGRDPARGITSDCGGVACGIEHPLAAETYNIDVAPASLVSADNLTYRISALVEVYPQWWISATYRLPSTGISLEGSARVTGAPRDGGVVQDGRALVNFDLPSTVDAAVRGRISPTFDLHVGGRWEDLSTFADYDVRLLGFDADVPDWIERPRGYHDALRLWAGVEQVDSGQRFLWGVRGGLSTPEVKTSRVSPTTVERWGVSVDVGGQYRIASGLRAQLSYGLEFQPAVDVRASEYDPVDRLDCIDSGYDYSTTACQHVRDGYAIPTAAGTYRRFEHSFRLGLRYDIP